MLPHLARVDLGAMAIKGYSAFPKAPASLEFHHQTVQCHIQDTRWERSYPSAEVQSVYSTAPADWASPTLIQDASKYFLWTNRKQLLWKRVSSILERICINNLHNSHMKDRRAWLMDITILDIFQNIFYPLDEILCFSCIKSWCDIAPFQTYLYLLTFLFFLPVCNENSWCLHLIK